MSKQETRLLIIDPQNDFCDIPGAALPVKGANADMTRLAQMIDRLRSKISSIDVSLDCHRPVHIAHPEWWTNSRGENPRPFTMITWRDVVDGRWMPRNTDNYDWAVSYTTTLELHGKFALIIWPPHCLVGTWGNNVHGALNSALERWSVENLYLVDYILKGMNPRTESYGAIKAEVVDPDDPDTDLNVSFLNRLEKSDIVLVAGEASSHCVSTTVNQIVESLGSEHLSKFHLLTDCMSPVSQSPGTPDFPALTKEWFRSMERLGMKLVRSVDLVL